MEFTEHALVLRVGCFREADLWVRFLSPSRGVLTAFAFGGAKSRRRFCGCLDALCHVHVRVKSTRRGAYLCLEEGALLDAPRRLRHDWRRLGLAVNCLKFLEALDSGVDGAARAYRLALDTVAALEDEPAPDALFAHFFRAKAAREQGFGPDFEYCAGCGASLEGGDGFFHVEEARVSCHACGPRLELGHASRGRRPLPLSAQSLALLGPVATAGPAAWSHADTPTVTRRQCVDVVDALVERHVGLRWSGSRFRNV